MAIGQTQAQSLVAEAISTGGGGIGETRAMALFGGLSQYDAFRDKVEKQLAALPSAGDSAIVELINKTARQMGVDTKIAGDHGR